MGAADFHDPPVGDYESEIEWAIRARNVMLPDGNLAPGLDVVIAGDVIIDIVESGSGRVPVGRTVDWPQGTLIPGLVDSHTHLTFSADSQVVHHVTSEPPAEQVARALGNAQRALVRGVTTVVDCGGRIDVLLAVRQASQAGTITCPHVLVSGAPITTTAGHCHWLGGIADTTDEVVRLARQLTQDGVDFIKVMLTGGNITAGSNPLQLQYPERTMMALGAECSRLGKPLVVHAHTEVAVELAARSGATVIVHASCQDSRGALQLSATTLEALISTGAAVDPTITVGALESFADAPSGATRRHQQRRGMLPLFSRMHDAGVVLLAGTDAGVPGVPHGNVAQAIVALHHEVGLTRSEALLSGTSGPASVFGVADQVGSIRPGMQADLVLLDADLQEDITALHRPDRVWVAGRMTVLGGRLQTERREAAPVPAR